MRSAVVPRSTFRRSSGLLVLVTVAVASASNPAAAQPASAPTGPTLVYPRAHTHDSMFFRMALGGGFVHATEERNYLTGSDTLTMNGGGLAFDLALGGAVRDGLILGGGLAVQMAPQAKTTRADGSSAGGDLNAALTVGGAMLEFYPNPRRGFHVGGVIGIAFFGDATSQYAGWLSPFEGSISKPSGFGLALDSGYELWVGRGQALGLLARVSFTPRASLHQDLPSFTSSEAIAIDTHDAAIALSALACVTFD